MNTLQHYHPDLPKVATCNKNSGNKPVDGIWCSPSIEILQAGMSDFGSPDIIHTDHRMLWVDFDAASVFGYHNPKLAPIEHLGIPMNDPQIGHRYNQRLKRARQRINFSHQLCWLEQRALDGTFHDHDGRLYNQLMRQDDELRDQCKIKIRKKYAGHVKYSDVIGKDRKTIRLWRLIQTCLHDRRVDTRKI
jgi:hypothetical protein